MATDIEKQREELYKQLRAKREALREFRFSVAKGKIKNIKEARNLRREIARILTTLRNLGNA